MRRAARVQVAVIDTGIADAILEAHDDRAQVINLSLDLRTTDDTPPPATAAAVAIPQSGTAVPWAMWSGTSFAAPQIAGAVARISYEEGLAPRAAVEKLAEFGTEIAGFGRAMRILNGVG